MNNPISGVGVQAAATQMRIIELDQVADQDISDSMNIAIDFTNQTFRLTGLQLRDWLTDALAFPAENVSFDSTVFESIFPDTPPANVQDALDFAFTDYVSESQGGTITKDANALNIQQITDNAGAYIRFNNTTDFSGFLGVPPSNLIDNIGFSCVSKIGDLLVESEDSSVKIEAATAVNIDAATAVSVTAPSTVINGAVAVNQNETAMTFRPTTLGGSTYQAWLDTDGQEMGLIGKTSAIFQIRAGIGSGMPLYLGADNEISLNAPTTNVSDTLNITGVSPTIKVNPEFPLILQGGYTDGLLQSFRFTNINGTQVADISGHGLATFNGDVIAFNGQAAAAQPAIAQTGLTTSFELIEHLLDKIEDLETIIDDLNIRLTNGGL